MKGLLYREWYLTKKDTLILFCTLAAFWILEILVQLSKKYGNIGKYFDDDDNMLTYYVFVFIVSILIIELFISTHNIITSDYIVRWNMYSYTLPVSERKIALVKTSKIVIGTIISIVLSTLNLMFLTSMNNKTFDTDMVWLIALCAMFFGVMEAIKVPLALYFRKDSFAWGVIFTFITVLMVIALIKIRNFNSSVKAETPDIDDLELSSRMFQKMMTFIHKYELCFPVLFVLIILIAYICTVKVLKRRVV